MARPTRGVYLTKGRARELERDIRDVRASLEARIAAAEKRADAASERADRAIELLAAAVARKPKTATARGG